jgi:hypothetical protein
MFTRARRPLFNLSVRERTYRWNHHIPALSMLQQVNWENKTMGYAHVKPVHYRIPFLMTYCQIVRFWAVSRTKTYNERRNVFDGDNTEVNRRHGLLIAFTVEHRAKDYELLMIWTLSYVGAGRLTRPWKAFRDPTEGRLWAWNLSWIRSLPRPSWGATEVENGDKETWKKNFMPVDKVIGGLCNRASAGCEY